jgi:hypothetical protein
LVTCRHKNGQQNIMLTCFFRFSNNNFPLFLSKYLFAIFFFWPLHCQSFFDLGLLPFLCLHVTNMYLFNLCLTYNICIGMCSIALCILTVWKRKEYHELLRSYVNRNIYLIKKNYEKPRNHSQTTHRKLHITQHELMCSGREMVKQQSAGRHVSQHGHIILIPSQPVFDLFP